MRDLLGVEVPTLLMALAVVVGLAFLRVGVFFSRRIFLLMWLELEDRREKSRMSCFEGVVDARKEDRRSRVEKCLSSGGSLFVELDLNFGAGIWVLLCSLEERPSAEDAVDRRFDGVLGTLDESASA